MSQSTEQSPLFRIAHLSDIHFGKISYPDVVPAIVDDVNDHSPDVVVISGDLTQRARDREFTPAREMIRSFEPPTVVIPGNHDVPPWWRPFHRLTNSSGPFRTYINENPTPTFVHRQDDRLLAIFGLDSSHGMSIAGGRIRQDHLEAMIRFFESQPEGTFKVLTVHHQLSRMHEIGPHDVARGAKRTLRRAAECGVDLILCGHLHKSYVTHIDVDVEAGKRIIVASAGTATSRRGRGDNKMVNFYNEIAVWDDHFAVEERRFDPQKGVFNSARVSPFTRLV